ncbi:MAG: hypothetical protein GKR89_12470 [Candidatus Latescibacteria bacterium]|nr:hypothetical protein [Candidatus Latescibacterota bacterium]
MQVRESNEFDSGLSPSDIAGQLRQLGLTEGSTVLVHASLRQIGPIRGGGQGLLQGIQQVVGPSGMIMVVSFSFGSVDPACWFHPPDPEDLENRRRETAPLSVHTPIDPCLGIFPRIVWDTPGARRSPCLSFVALGHRAEELVANRDLGRSYGPTGPFGELHKVDGWVLYAGVGFSAATSVHRAEDQMDLPYLVRDVPLRYKISEGEWIQFDEGRDYGCSAHFKSVIPVLQASGALKEGKVGQADSYLVRHNHVVQAAISLLQSDRAALLCNNPDCEWCVRAQQILADERMGSN